MININSINPNLRRFIFHSQTMVLKNAFNGYSYRCFTKSSNQTLYQYFTMVPNCSNGNKPVDFLTSFDGKNKKAYILLGHLIEKIPYNEFENLYKKMEELVELEGHIEIPSEKLDVILKYYQTRFFNDKTIEDMLKLQATFSDYLTNSYLSKFTYRFYEYYQAVEKARLDRLKSALLANEVQKAYKLTFDK